MVENFQSLEHVWIEMPDGVRLAARIWLPSNALTKPAPAVFEYIPYRKVDMVRARDERNHPYLAENGIVAVRVDCLLYTSPSPRDQRGSRMPSSA